MEFQPCFTQQDQQQLVFQNVFLALFENYDSITLD